MKISEKDFKWMYQSALNNEWKIFMPADKYYADGGFYSWLLKYDLHRTLNHDVYNDGIQDMIKPHTYDEVNTHGVKSCNVLRGDKLYNALMSREMNKGFYGR